MNHVDLPSFIGLKYVITGILRNVVCSDGRYQPIKFWANQNNDCLYSKSQCNGIGQVVYDNRSTIYDATCSCDYIRGYAFVSEPRNKCFCTSSEEDCSCYIKQCPNYTILSPGKCLSIYIFYSSLSVRHYWFRMILFPAPVAISESF